MKARKEGQAALLIPNFQTLCTKSETEHIIYIIS
jgi:hypothetical protein